MKKKISGNISKMKTEPEEPVHYHLPAGNQIVDMQKIIGNELSINYLNQINCISCGRKTQKSYFQGYCFPCFRTLPQTDEDVLHPERCRAHLGIARDMEWAEKHCLIDHYVYLAITGGIKVGVTRHTQVPVRWIDQGAETIIKLCKTPDRYTAGMIEVALKKHIPDKTNWRKMLSARQNEYDLRREKQKALSYLPDKYKIYQSADDEIFHFSYPVEKYPVKPTAVKLETTPHIQGVLSGIKGQYLIFENGNVFNIRKHNGYLVEITCNQ